MLLSAEHLSINFGSRQLLDDVNFYLNEGDKAGIIGINGTGKSTFLKVLAGVTEPDAGTVARNPNVQVSVLPQNPVMEDSATVLEQVFLHFPAEFRKLNEYEAKSMLNRLGLPDVDKKIGELSGGQRKRAALAAALIHPADVLILDEPTNHLDSEMVAWLEDWLRRFRGGLVMVTHDRYFLERAVNRITELSRGKLYHYEANYSKYLELKEERSAQACASERKRQSILRREREWIMRGCRARSTKSKERIQRYEDLLAQDAPEADGTVQMAAAASRLGKKLIELRDVSKSYGGHTVIGGFSMQAYQKALVSVGDFDKSCGFICGKADLEHWNPLEICHLLHTTKDYYGALEKLVPAYTMEDERNYVKFSLNNLYHEICHRYIHADREANISRLPMTCKSIFFIMQHLHYLSSGNFIQTKRELLECLQGEDKAILEWSISLKGDMDYDFDGAFSRLFSWCQKALLRI